MGNICGWWLPDAATDKNPGICSPTNPSAMPRMPGRWFWLMPPAGRLKWRSVSINVNWLLKARACAGGISTPPALDCHPCLCFPAFPACLPRFALRFVFCLVPAYRKVESPRQGSTLPSVLRSLPPLALLPSSLPPKINFGMSHAGFIKIRVTIQPCHCEPFSGDREAYPKGKQSPVYQASLTAWGLLRRKERSSQ